MQIDGKEVDYIEIDEERDGNVGMTRVEITLKNGEVLKYDLVEII